MAIRWQKKRSVFSKSVARNGRFPTAKRSRARFLKKDSIKFAKANGMFREGVGNISGEELMNLIMIQIFVLPASQKKNRIETEEGSSEISIKLRVLCHRQSR